MRLGRQKDSPLEGDQLVGVGRRITEARLEAGMTKMELAEKLGVPLGLFERYEAGGEDPSPHLGRLAQVTGKPVTWFRGEAPGEAGATDDEAAAAEAEPEVIEPEEEPVLLPENEPAASNGGSSEPDETTVEPLVLGDPDPEPDSEPDEPLPAASEPEAEPEPEVSGTAAAASAASVADDGDDDLYRLLSSLGRQREQWPRAGRSSTTANRRSPTARPTSSGATRRSPTARSPSTTARPT